MESRRFNVILGVAAVAQLESAPAERWEYVWFKSHPLLMSGMGGKLPLRLGLYPVAEHLNGCRQIERSAGCFENIAVHVGNQPAAKTAPLL